MKSETLLDSYRQATVDFDRTRIARRLRQRKKFEEALLKRLSVYDKLAEDWDFNVDRDMVVPLPMYAPTRLEK